jgi:hypothetical protein
VPAVNYLTKYSRKIVHMHQNGMGAERIAAYLFDHPMRGQWPGSYRDQQVRGMTGAIRRYLSNIEAAVEEKRRLEQDLARRREARTKRREAAFATTPPWRDRNWEDVLPSNIAARQHTWCRRRAALRMVQAGLRYTEIGYRLRVTPHRARQIVESGAGHRLRPSPLELYLGELVVIDGYSPLVTRKEAGRMLKLVEVWTGRTTVPPCSVAEQYVWELYYSMREDA